MFKGISGIGSFLKQAHQLTGKIEELNEEMRNHRATGSAGGGMVVIEVNGLYDMVSCRIDPQLLAQGDAELIEDLIVSAYNQAMEEAKDLYAKSFNSLAKGLTMPGADEAMGKLFGGAAKAEPSEGNEDQDSEKDR